MNFSLHWNFDRENWRSLLKITFMVDTFFARYLCKARNSFYQILWLIHFRSGTGWRKSKNRLSFFASSGPCYIFWCSYQPGGNAISCSVTLITLEASSLQDLLLEEVQFAVSYGTHREQGVG